MTDATKKRAPKKPIDTSWHPRFIRSLECGANVRMACKDAGVTSDTAYTHRQRFPDFARQWAEAMDLGIAELESVARRRAIESSDVLMIFLLKAHRPEVYRETHRHEVSGPSGQAVPVEITDARAKLAALIARRQEADD